jgi:hypothetical protein
VFDEAAMTDAKKLNWSMIGVIVALVIQAAALVFGLGGLTQRVSTLEQTVAPLNDGTLARLDERTRAMKEQLDRIERSEVGR